MTSKTDRSEGQLNRLSRRALALLKWIREELGVENISLDQIHDTMPLEDAVEPSVIIACEGEIRRLKALFGELRQKNLIHMAETKDRWALTGPGKEYAVQASTRLMQELFGALSHTGDKIRWSTIGGKPLSEGRTDAQLINDLLVKIICMKHYQMYGHVDRDDVVGAHKLDDLRNKQKTRREHQVERGRATAAFNWLVEQEYLEPDGDGLYRISLKGDQYLEAEAS